MSFGHPYLLLALLVLPVAAWFYVRRAGRRELSVPSLAFWKAAADAASAEAGRRLGSFDWPLCLALSFLAAAILAASGPVIRVGTAAAPHVLVVADRSASMATMTEPGERRWKKSGDAVAGLLDRINPERVTLVGLPLAVGPAPEKLNGGEAARRLRELAATDMPLDLPAELSRVSGLAAGVSSVIVITDNPAAVPTTLGGKPVAVVSDGGPSRNIGIDAFEVSQTETATLSVFLGVVNHSGVAVEDPVTIEAAREGEQPVFFDNKLSIAPGARGTLVQSFPLSEAARVEARLNVKDDLESDNRVMAARSGAGRVRVAYAGRGNSFIFKALAQLPAVDVSQFRLAGDVSGQFDLFIYDGVTPARLPSGDVVLIDPVGRVGPFSVENAGSPNMRAVAAAESSLLRSIDLAPLRFNRAVKLTGGPAADTLVRAVETDAALLARWSDERTGLTIIGCGLTLEDTNWPLNASFPIFWANLVADAVGRRNMGVPTCWLTGEYVPVREPASATLTVTGPRGESISVVPGAGARDYFLAPYAGLYAIRAGSLGRSLAVNMTHPLESANGGSASWSPSFIGNMLLARGGGRGVPVWRYLAIAALVSALGYWAAAGHSRR